MGQLGNIKISSPTFGEKLPSTGEKITITPFRVGDEKTLLIASQSEDNMEMLRALKTIVGNCTQGVSIKDMTPYDVEYLFLKLRARSVGETSDIGVACVECEAFNQITVDLSAVVVEKKKEHKEIIKITDNLAFKMKALEPELIVDLDMNNPDDLIKMVMISVSQVFSGEEVIDVEPSDHEELKELIESMTSTQFEMLQDFFNTLPKLVKDIEFTCGSCGHENKQRLEGLSSFF